MTNPSVLNEASIQEVVQELIAGFPDAECELTYETPFQLLIATILSAQCTDKRVNQVTPKLFQSYPDAKAMAQATQDDLIEIIRSTGFFNNKSKSILACSQALTDQYNGTIPDTMQQLIQLPGIGRKTANVVLGNAFGKPAIMVDTHCKRVAQRLGLTQESNPDKIEFDLQKIIQESYWTPFSRAIVLHGRYTCTAKKPSCNTCALTTWCLYYKDQH